MKIGLRTKDGKQTNWISDTILNRKKLYTNDKSWYKPASHDIYKTFGAILWEDKIKKEYKTSGPIIWSETVKEDCRVIMRYGITSDFATSSVVFDNDGTETVINSTEDFSKFCMSKPYIVDGDITIAPGYSGLKITIDIEMPVSYD